MVQLVRLSFNVHERPCPDRPKVSEVRILAVESLVRRRIGQRRVWTPITEVDSRQHQLSQRNLGRPESASNQHTISAIVLPARSFAPICCEVLEEANSIFMAVSRQYCLKAGLRTFVRLETIQANTGRNHKTLVEQLEKIDGLRLLLDEKDLLPLCVLVNELCRVGVTTQRLRGYGAHGVNGD